MPSLPPPSQKPPLSIEEQLEEEFERLKRSEDGAPDPKTKALIVLSGSSLYQRGEGLEEGAEEREDFERIEHALSIAGAIAKKRGSSREPFPLIYYLCSKEQGADLLEADGTKIAYPKERLRLLEVREEEMNTKGQMAALKRAKLQRGSFGIITHAYHFPRVARMLSEGAPLYPFGQEVSLSAFLVDRRLKAPSLLKKIEAEKRKIPLYISKGDLSFKGSPSLFP